MQILLRFKDKINSKILNNFLFSLLQGDLKQVIIICFSLLLVGTNKEASKLPQSTGDKVSESCFLGAARPEEMVILLVLVIQ